MEDALDEVKLPFKQAMQGSVPLLALNSPATHANTWNPAASSLLCTRKVMPWRCRVVTKNWLGSLGTLYQQ